jgi:hypothetical protein
MQQQVTAKGKRQGQDMSVGCLLDLLLPSVLACSAGKCTRFVYGSVRCGVQILTLQLLPKQSMPYFM